MTTVSLLSSARSAKADALIVLTRPTDGHAEAVGDSTNADDALGTLLAGVLSTLKATGKSDEVVKMAAAASSDVAVVVAAGLGDVDLDDPPARAQAVREAVGSAVRALAGAGNVVLDVTDGDVAAAAEGALLGGYTFERYKSKPGTAPVAKVSLRGSSNAASRKAVARAKVIGTAVGEIRDLVNTAPAELYPATFADRVTRLATSAGAACEVLDEKALRRGNYGGILGVGRGSSHPPRLVRITHRPARPKAKIALVGKGITYDSGGYSIKIPQSGSMKGDMAGAATVLLAAIAAAELNLPVEVTATAALAENLVSSTSYLVSDVLTMRNGTTVEVDNTDAEGRLVLADAIVRAGEDDPDYLLEASTLTGAALVALGERTAAVLGEAAWRDRILDAAALAGEAMWPLPLLKDLRSGLDSPVADLRNVAGGRFGGTIVAGLFLAEFVKPGLPWAHLDIAGPAWQTGGAFGYTPKGGTGFGLRTMITLLESLGG